MCLQKTFLLVSVETIFKILETSLLYFVTLSVVFTFWAESAVVPHEMYLGNNVETDECKEVWSVSVLQMKEWFSFPVLWILYILEGQKSIKVRKNRAWFICVCNLKGVLIQVIYHFFMEIFEVKGYMLHRVLLGFP